MRLYIIKIVFYIMKIQISKEKNYGILFKISKIS